MTIGIVTISFNQVEFLEDAIRSVTVDPPDGLEYVVVDPGSTDGSRQIIESHRPKLADVVLEKDSGPPDGLNRGFARLEKAEICGYLNSDDRFAPGALNYVCDYFRRNPKTDILLGSISIIDRKGKPSYRARSVETISLAKILEGNCCVWQQATFFRREAFLKTRGFNVHNKVTWDWELVVDLLIAGAKVSYTSRVLGDFRIYPGSMTGSGELLKQRDQQSARVREKICLSCGIPPREASRASEWLDKVNPVRHLRNVGVGTAELLRRRTAAKQNGPGARNNPANTSPFFDREAEL